MSRLLYDPNLDLERLLVAFLAFKFCVKLLNLKLKYFYY